MDMSKPFQIWGCSLTIGMWISGARRDSIDMVFGCCVVG